MKCFRHSQTKAYVFNNKIVKVFLFSECIINTSIKSYSQIWQQVCAGVHTNGSVDSKLSQFV